MKIYGVEYCGDGYISVAYKTKELAFAAVLEEYFGDPSIDPSKVKKDIINLLTYNYIDEYVYIDEIELKD